MLELLKQTDTSSVLIFTRTKHRAERLAQQLERAGYRVTALHSNRSQNQRQAALDGFRDGTLPDPGRHRHRRARHRRRPHLARDQLRHARHRRRLHPPHRPHRPRRARGRRLHDDHAGRRSDGAHDRAGCRPARSRATRSPASTTTRRRRRSPRSHRAAASRFSSRSACRNARLPTAPRRPAMARARSRTASPATARRAATVGTPARIEFRSSLKQQRRRGDATAPLFAVLCQEHRRVSIMRYPRTY